MAVFDQLNEPAFGEHAVGQVQPGELVLVRLAGHRQALDQPVVERSVVLELHGADGVGDAFDGIGLAMGEVIGRIDAPGIAGARVRGVDDAVEHRVAQVDVARGHVDLCPERPRPLRKLTGPHAQEEIQVLLDGPRAIGAVPAGLGQAAAVFADFLRAEVIHVGLALFDQMFGPSIELLEVVRGEVKVLAPIEAQPGDVCLYGIDVFLFFLGGVGVVETQGAVAAELAGHTEIEADRLGMPDVEVAVGLRREAGHHLGGAAGRQVAGNDVTDEVTHAGCGGIVCGGLVVIHLLWGFPMTIPKGEKTAAFQQATG